MTRTKLRVACAGAGYFSRFQYEAWQRMDDVEIVAICNRTAEGAHKTAAEFSIPAVFTDFGAMLDAAGPDLVDIITPPVTHYAYVREASARGIAAICQKPFCRDLTEAKNAVAIARAAGSILVVHENFRFQPWHRECRRVIEAGVLGGVYQAVFRLRPGDGQGPRAYLDRQPYFQSMERFLVHETAIHFVDTFRYLFGEVEAVYASLRRLNPVIVGEDAGLILFDHTSGVRSVFDGNRLVDHAARNRRLTMGEMLVEGSAGVLRLDGEGRLWLRHVGFNRESAHHFAWDDRGFGGDCVYRLQRHVVDALRQGGALENTAADYIRNLEIEAAIYRSSDAEYRVKI